MNKLCKKTLASLMALSLVIPSLSSIGSVYADDVTDISISVEPTTIDITVPLNFSCNINPNVSDGFTYANNITVINNTTCPINLGIASFQDEDKNFENDILPTGLPDGKTWDSLSVSDTKKYFALGIKEKDKSEWMQYALSNPVYAKTINESLTNIYFGEVASNGSVNFDLEASYGKAFKTSKTFSYKLTWVAELYDGDDASATTYTVDKEASTNLTYDLTKTSTQSNSVVGLINMFYMPVHAVSVEEINEDNIVGTCLITGVKNTNVSDIYVADYYEDTDGNLYEITGVKKGNTNLGTCDKITSITTNDSTIADDIAGELSYDKVANATVTVKDKNYVLELAATPDVTSENIVCATNDENIFTFDTTSEPDNNYPSYQGNACAGSAAIRSVKEQDENVILPTYYYDGANYYYVTTLKSYSFTNNSVVKTIYIPSSLKTIQTEAMYSNENVESYSVGENSETFCTVDGVLYSKDLTAIWGYPATKDASSYLLPSTITQIGSSTFCNNESLVSINIPKGVISIGDTAFAYCRNLENVNLASDNKLEKIGQTAFMTTKISKFDIPTSLTYIGSSAFMNSNGQVDVDFTYNGKKVYFDDSHNCLFEDEGFTTLLFIYDGYGSETCYLPSTVTTIKPKDGINENSHVITSSYKNLKKIILPESLTKVEKYSFTDGPDSLTLVYPNEDVLGLFDANNCTLSLQSK